MGGMPDGTLKWRVNRKYRLPGFEEKSEGMISFEYMFSSGEQLVDDKKLKYSGTRRQAFLPYNEDGIVIFNRLIQAFERRLTFMVGTSLTTGLTDTVVWAGIHHKTSHRGGPFGFPDETYLERVRDELKVRGIIETKTEMEE